MVGFGRRKTAAFDLAVSFDWSSDGSLWNSISADITTGSTTSWDFLSFSLPAGAEGVSNLQFRFVYTVPNSSTNCSSTFKIDDFAVGENSALPIVIKSFVALALPTSTRLSFSTATELNNSHFVIERSADARTFSEIGRVQGAGTTRVPQSYTFTDEKPLSGLNYYRLRQVDFDGAESLSGVVSVVFGKAGSITIAPSPATDRVRIQLDEALTNDGLWQVFDNMGRQVLSGGWEAESADFELDVNTLPEGMYTFRLAVGTQVQVKQFRKL